MEEIWSNIPNEKEWYFVSNKGNIKTTNYKNTGNEKYISLMKTNTIPRNRLNKRTLYYRCKLSSKERLVHRLVAMAFIPNPHNKPEVNHIDGNPLNNNVDNLEWCTRSENALHANRTGLRPSPTGDKSGMAKFTNSEMIELKKIIDSGFYRQSDIGKVYGVHQATISKIKLGKTWNI